MQAFFYDKHEDNIAKICPDEVFSEIGDIISNVVSCFILILNKTFLLRIFERTIF